MNPSIPIIPEEPTFTLRGRDMLGGAMVRLWAAIKHNMGNVPESAITTAKASAKAMMSFYENHDESGRQPIRNALEWVPFDLLAAELRRRGLPLPTVTEAPVERNPETGLWLHPAFPFDAAQEECSIVPVIEGLGLEHRFVSASEDMTPEQFEAIMEEANCSPWQPSPPEGDGWFLIAVLDNEDGYFALFVRPVSSTKKGTAMSDAIDPKLTHRIIVDGGQWARGATEAEARAEFRRLHSARELTDAQVWAVTAETAIDDMGRFHAPKPGWVYPKLLKGQRT